MMDGRSPSWMADAACQGKATERWFPKRGQATRDQKAVCATCPVKTECLIYALEQRIVHGIWGGTSERERRRMRALARTMPKAVAS